MIALFHSVAFLCYSSAMLTLAVAFAGRATHARAPLVLVLIGAVLHGASLVLFTRTFGELPLVGLAPSLSALAFVIAVFLLLILAIGDLRSIALIVLPIIGSMVLIALALGVRPVGEPLMFSGAWFAVHVVFAFVAYAGLTVSFAAGVLYLLQFRELKGKRLGRVFRFVPPLPTLDRLGKVSLLVAFPSLTVALVVGWSWTLQFRSAFTTERAQIIWGMATWIIIALMLAVRSPGLAGRERRGAIASVAGFVVVLLLYFLLRLAAARDGFL